jgi:hypothetical protein
MRSNANGKRDRDGLIIIALAGGASYADAARVGRVSKATVARRMAEPAFRAKVFEEREKAIDQVRGLLVDGSIAAVRSILLLAQEAVSESVRLAAASRVLDLVLRRRPGFDTFTTQEVSALVLQLVELSVARIPEEQQEPFIREVRSIGAA